MNKVILEFLNLYSHTYRDIHHKRNRLSDTWPGLILITYDWSSDSFQVFDKIDIFTIQNIYSKLEIFNGIRNCTFHELDWGESWFIIDKEVFLNLFGDKLDTIKKEDGKAWTLNKLIFWADKWGSHKTLVVKNPILK